MSIIPNVRAARAHDSMYGTERFSLTLVFAVAFMLALTNLCSAQGVTALHHIEGRVRARSNQLRGIHVRLLLEAEMRPITETFTNAEGQFAFKSLREGAYLIETYETDQFESTNTRVNLFPPDREHPTSQFVMVLIDLPLKSSKTTSTGVINADVDLHVPKEALKHYRAVMEVLDSADSARAITELQAAIAIYSQYYAARLELGRELRLEKRFEEAAKILQPLGEIAPTRSEPRLEYGIVLLELQRREEAARELSKALQLEENNWATHLYLGWALLETEENTAERHFQRALELDERKAARAHIALARIADAKGLRQVALQHLDAYLTLAPNAPDSEAVRKLAERLRK